MKPFVQLLIFFLSASNISFGQNFTFKKGVTLNHWTAYPIKGWSYADPKWFTEKDVEWIAKMGLDHIQLHISGKEIADSSISLSKQKISVVDSLIKWCKKNKLGTIITLAELPDFKIDTTLSKEKQNEGLLNKQVIFWDALAKYFKKNKKDVRFLIDRLSIDSLHQNVFYENVIRVIKKHNTKRKIYLSVSALHLDDIKIPKNDPGICISAEMNVATAAENEAIDIFLLQHMFRKRIPLISFPSTLPSFDSLRANHWASKHIGVRLDENYLNEKFKNLNVWMKTNHPEKEFYLSHWRYFTGWPYSTETVIDKQSIRNFGNAFTKTTQANNINWCIYDYNSGSCIRLPTGEKALILEALEVE